MVDIGVKKAPARPKNHLGQSGSQENAGSFCKIQARISRECYRASYAIERSGLCLCNLRFELSVQLLFGLAVLAPSCLRRRRARDTFLEVADAVVRKERSRTRPAYHVDSVFAIVNPRYL